MRGKRNRPSRLWHATLVCLVAWNLSVSGSLTQETQANPPAPEPNTPPQVVAIPDGTKVELRFVQAVRGKSVSKNANLVPGAKAGDTVRLVATVTVSVNGLVVVAKGAIAQATVTKVATFSLAPTGLKLRLDWVEDVTGRRVPLRTTERGQQEATGIQVLSDKGGLVAFGTTTRGTFFGRYTLDPSYLWRFRMWIPVGTRILGFVHGAVPLDLGEVREAQALLPLVNAEAMLTIFRGKGQKDHGVRVFCDGQKATELGAQQYSILELKPGRHSCRPENEKAVEFAAQPAEEYFLRLHSPALSGGWELERVSAAVGEDAIANAKPAAEQ